MSCRFVASDQPRVIPRRHLEECEGEPCTGCQPCTESHCRVCGKEHAEGACGACLAEVRDDLAEITKLCRALPAEAATKGVDSEAMALLAPAANPEAWGHITTSVAVGRLPDGYLSCDRCDNPYPCTNPKHATGERHPMFVLGSWEEVWRDALDHETEALFDLFDAAAYLGRQMSYMATFEHAPFEDFARDLRRCRNHLESVLHDGEQRETGAPCLTCEIPQSKCWRGRELPWSKREHPVLASEDGWACPRCKTFSKPAQYNLAVTEEHRKKAEWLTDVDMEIRTLVKAATVRSWARDEFGLVRKKRHSERMVYNVQDVFAVARDKGVKCA